MSLDGVVQVPDHPGGWLVFKNLPEPYRSAEDATAVADYQRARHRPRFRRPATDTEKALLTHLGHPLPAGDAPALETWVCFLTIGRGVRRRVWPTLDPTLVLRAHQYPPLPEGAPL